MDKYIAIIAAEDKELEAIKNIMNNIEEVNKYNLKIFKCNLNKNKYLIVKCGMGKVNAARTAQILTDMFDLDYIINVGSAGGLNENLQIGDIVIGKQLIQHDFDITAMGREKGEIPDVGKIFKSDKELIVKCKKIKIDNVNIIEGTIVSGDIFCTDVKMKENLVKEFNADCTEMEGAAIAQACFLNSIPFVVIRSISDIPNGKNIIDFNEYLDFASQNCARFIEQLNKL